MNGQENIKKIYEQAKLDTVVERDKAVLEKMKDIYLQESKAGPKTPELSVWRKFMLTKTKYKVAALLGCIILVSVAAAVTVPSVYNTIRTFISAFDNKEIGILVELTDPMYAVHQQVQDLKNVITTESKLKLASLYADDNNAIAFTTDVIVINDESDRSQDQKGPLVITLTRKDNMWSVIDIDLENEKTIKIELERFLEYYPNAIEIKLN